MAPDYEASLLREIKMKNSGSKQDYKNEPSESLTERHDLLNGSFVKRQNCYFLMTLVGTLAVRRDRDKWLRSGGDRYALSLVTLAVCLGPGRQSPSAVIVIIIIIIIIPRPCPCNDLVSFSEFLFFTNCIAVILCGHPWSFSYIGLWPSVT